jgi:hypothetical protein
LGCAAFWFFGAGFFVTTAFFVGVDCLDRCAVGAGLAFWPEAVLRLFAWALLPLLLLEPLLPEDFVFATIFPHCYGDHGLPIGGAHHLQRAIFRKWFGLSLVIYPYKPVTLNVLTLTNTTGKRHPHN